MNEPAWTITNAAGIIEYVGHKPAASHGLDIAQAVGKSPGAAWGGKMDRAFYTSLWHHLRDDHHGAVATLYNRQADGSYAPETLCILPITATDNEQLFFAVQQSHLASLEQAYDVPGEYQDVISALRYMFDGYQGRMLHKPISMPKQIGDWLKEGFVLPMREQFAVRQEDAQLIAKAQAQTQAFADIYEKYYDVVFAYAAYRLPTAQDAEDVTQEVFLRAFTHLPAFVNRNSTYKTYLLRVAHRAIIDRYRKEKDTFAIRETDAKTGLAQAAHALRQGLSHMPIKDAELLRAKHLYGYSVRELAKAEETSENAIKLRLSRARKKLRLLLEK